MNKEKSRIQDQNQQKSALKKRNQKSQLEYLRSKQLQVRRFDRKGQEIKQGSKYEITINDQAEYFNQENELANLNLSNSLKQENIDNNYTLINLKTSRSLELNQKEEAFLKMLSYNFEKNKKKGKRKECCIIW